MNYSEIRTILLKEYLEIFRDKKTLALMFFMMLLYPLFLVGSIKLMQSRAVGNADRITRVRVETDQPTMVSRFHSDKMAVVKTADPNPDTGLLKGKYDAVVIFPPNFQQSIEDVTKKPPKVVVRLDDRRDNMMTSKRVFEILDDIESSQLHKRLAALDVPEEWHKDFAFNYKVVADSAQRSGSWVGLSMPIALVLMILTATLYPALDLVTGERERGTLTLLLVSPASRRNIMVAKLLAVFTVGMVASILLFACLFLTLHFGVTKLDDIGGSFAFQLPVAAGLASLPLCIPLVLALSAIAMCVSSYAKTFQQGQSYFVPYLLGASILSMAALIPSNELPPILGLVPIANVAISLRDILQGVYNWGFLALTFVSSSVYAYLAMRMAVNLLDREEALFDVQTAVHSPQRLFRAAGAVFAINMLAMFYLGQPLQAVDPIFGMIATQVLVIALPSILAIKFLKLDLRSTLSLYRPETSALVGGLFLAGFTVFLASCIVIAQNMIAPMPESYSQALLKHVIPAGRPIWLVLLAMAVTPAICEELMFRGALQGLLAPSLKGARLWATIGLIFGLFHFSLFRLLPTAFLGSILSWIVWRNRSIFPAMCVHAAHNSLAVLSVLYSIEPFSPPALAAAGLGLIIATLLLRMSPPLASEADKITADSGASDQGHENAASREGA